MSEADLTRAYDVVILGAGAAGMTAAAVAAREGLDVLVVEKTGLIGGTTAISGGMVWAPGNAAAAAVGHRDTTAAARAYLAAVVGERVGGQLRQRFVDRAAEAVAYLERNTAVRLVPLAFYPDYYPDLPGAALGGRVMEPEPFDGRALGDAFALLRPPLPEFTLFGGMMVARPDIAHFRRVFRSPRSALRVAGLVARYALQRLGALRGTDLVLGNALAGRLLKSLLGLRVPVALNATVQQLRVEAGRIAGVVLETETGLAVVSARRGVVLATGGFSRNQELRRRLLPDKAGPHSAAAEGNTGDGIGLGTAVGGTIPGGNASNAFWVPVSAFVRGDGRAAVFPHTVTDRGKPGMLAVGRDGRRFTNEADSYHEFVQAMLRADAAGGTVPCFLLCDSTALWRYGLGAVRPMTARLSPHLRSGYLLEASSISALAARIGADAHALEATVARYNADAAAGIDSQFGRGSNAYHRYVGDADCRPNPCMAPVEKPPFYAVALHPGDLGTAAGLATGPDGQVLDDAGTPVPGLYACGNDMNSIMAGAYPGPGITLGPALVFGYLAAMHLAGGR